MNLLKADDMQDLQNYRVCKLTCNGEERYILLQWQKVAPYPYQVRNGILTTMWETSFHFDQKPYYWDNFPKTEAEAWEHLPHYLKEDNEDYYGTL